jgi:hypothetical protein
MPKGAATRSALPVMADGCFSGFLSCLAAWEPKIGPGGTAPCQVGQRNVPEKSARSARQMAHVSNTRLSEAAHLW